MPPSDLLDANLEFWQRGGDEWFRRRPLRTPDAAWGVWRIPESDLRLLGEVHDRDVLEAGCGFARFSIALARQGARITALDVSERQLEQASAAVQESHADVRLLCASVDAIPLPDESLDIVFSDRGALDYCDPYASIPEVARVLRVGGRLVFCGPTPLATCCWSTTGPRFKLQRGYFSTTRLEHAGGPVEFQLPYGAWIALFSRCGLLVEGLTELRPPDEVTSWPTPLLRWAREFPAEHVWQLRKASGRSEVVPH